MCLGSLVLWTSGERYSGPSRGRNGCHLTSQFFHGILFLRIKRLKSVLIDYCLRDSCKELKCWITTISSSGGTNRCEYSWQLFQSLECYIFSAAVQEVVVVQWLWVEGRKRTLQNRLGEHVIYCLFCHLHEVTGFLSSVVGNSSSPFPLYHPQEYLAKLQAIRRQNYMERKRIQNRMIANQEEVC